MASTSRSSLVAPDQTQKERRESANLAGPFLVFQAQPSKVPRNHQCCPVASPCRVSEARLDPSRSGTRFVADGSCSRRAFQLHSVPLVPTRACRIPPSPAASSAALPIPLIPLVLSINGITAASKTNHAALSHRCISSANFHATPSFSKPLSATTLRAASPQLQTLSQIATQIITLTAIPTRSFEASATLRKQWMVLQGHQRVTEISAAWSKAPVAVDLTYYSPTRAGAQTLGLNACRGSSSLWASPRTPRLAGVKRVS